MCTGEYGRRARVHLREGRAFGIGLRGGICRERRVWKLAVPEAAGGGEQRNSTRSYTVPGAAQIPVGSTPSALAQCQAASNWLKLLRGIGHPRALVFTHSRVQRGELLPGGIEVGRGCSSRQTPACIPVVCKEKSGGPDPKSCAVGVCKPEAPPPSCDIFAQSFSAGGLF